jgi:aerobic carbon-monoxide dehydrogenase large subunit
VIGDSMLRVEDMPLLTGGGRFAADIRLDGETHMRVVRSPVPHGIIRGIDLSAAKAMPGVLAVWSASDIDLGPINFRLVAFPQLLAYRQPVLPRIYLRYVGEPVAMVVAEDAYVAEDAADAVQLDIEALEPVLDPCIAPAPFDEEHDTEALFFENGYGDVASAFADASHVIELTVRVGRHTGVPLECRGALADYQRPRGTLDFYGAAKVPHYNRTAIAAMLGMPPHLVVLREGHVGGGFGVRGELYPEDVLVCWASRELGRPVKWIEDRQEHLVAANHSRDQVHHIRAATTGDGFVTAIDDEFWLDQGAYIRTHAATVPTLTATMLPGPYQIPAYRVRAHVRLTNKTPAGTYRSPGRYEATFARERLMDAIAEQVGAHPFELRHRNFIMSGQMPFARPLAVLGTELEYDSGDYALLVEKAQAQFGIAALERELAQRRAAGEAVGMGSAFFVEKSGLGPYETVRLSVDETGHVDVVTGAGSMGQGFETMITQVCAHELGVPAANIRVRHDRTDDIDHALGAFASRLTVMAGSATMEAARSLREKAVQAAARMLEADQRDLEYAGGVVRVVGDPGACVPIGEIAAALSPDQASRWGLAPSLSAEGWHACDHMCYPYGLHVAVVRADRGTGHITAERVLVAYDVGRAVNPMLVESQIVGGAAQGLGGALLEEFRYDADGQPQCTTFMDYLMPTRAEMPPVDVLITEDAPSPRNPLGVKGAGEGGVTGMGAAIAAAIDAAVGVPGGILELPVRAETVLALLRRANPRSTSVNGGS